MIYIAFIIALAIAFFLKGADVSSKIMAVVIFIIGISCFEASSFWWRIGYVLLVLSTCDTGEKHRQTKPYMGIALTIVVMSLVKLIATDFAGCYPSWLFNFLAIAGSVVYIVNNKK